MLNCLDQPRLMEDAEYLLQLENDRHYYWDIWLLYKSRLFKYCVYRLFLNYHDAEDLCSETMLKAYECLPKAHSDSNIFAILCSICKFTHYDGVRRQGFYQRYQKEAVEEDIEVEISAYFQKERDLEALGFIQNVVKSLPEKIAPMCWAYFFNQESYREISQRFDCTEAYVRKQIYKVRLTLDAAYRRYLNDHQW